MTNKFWKDWQKRAYYTKNIYIQEFLCDKTRVVKPLLYKGFYKNIKLKKIEFINDIVNLTIEEEDIDLDNKHQINTKTLTFNRKDIVTVVFENMRCF